jgi:methionine-rich copper-binding protein CopC
MTRLVPVRRPGLLLVAATALVLLLPGLVAAHAELETSSPKDTEVVPGTPAEIWGTYSEAVKVEGSSLVLQDAASGKELARGGVDPDDDKRMVITPVPELALGDYIVKSTTVSADDNDIDREQWIFTVAPAASASPSAAPSATPAPTPSASTSASPSATTSASPTAAPSLSPTPAPSPSGSGSSTGSGTDALLPIVVVLVLLAVLGGYLYSRRGSSTTPAP